MLQNIALLSELNITFCLEDNRENGSINPPASKILLHSCWVFVAWERSLICAQLAIINMNSIWRLIGHGRFYTAIFILFLVVQDCNLAARFQEKRSPAVPDDIAYTQTHIHTHTPIRIHTSSFEGTSILFYIRYYFLCRLDATFSSSLSVHLLWKFSYPSLFLSKYKISISLWKCMVVCF